MTGFIKNIQDRTGGSAQVAGALSIGVASYDTAAAEVLRIDSSGRGLADFAAFAWMYYDDRQSQFQSLASGASYNVSSIAAGDTNGSASEGDYKITFTNAAPNAVYCIMAGGNSDWAAYASPYEGSQTTTEFDIQGSEGGGYNDLEEIYILVHAIKG